jgi:aspartate/methionine/tyrosine aminotransferase
LDLLQASVEQLQHWQSTLQREYQQQQQKKQNLDLTRGKPSSEQLTLSDSLDGCLRGDYFSKDGTDTRNYGGLDGILEARQLGAEILGVKSEEVSAQGNSSLTLMFLTLLCAKEFGLSGEQSAWKLGGDIKFLCPVPGYDRHFRLCEQLGLEMVAVPMTATGPDMDTVENMVKADSRIKGMWCVPKYSNPTGVVYSDSTVERIARLGEIAGADFRVLWDNAYAVHDLEDSKPLKNIMDLCRGTSSENSVIQFASTSKITYAGSGVAFIAASQQNINSFRKLLSVLSIGPDKVNQLRHLRLIPDYKALLAHMKKHAEFLRPRFACVLEHFSAHFSDNDLGQWEAVSGGYFVSFNSRPGLAKQIVKLAAELGVKLTPAGATFPYGKDPDDCNIRIAPSVPSLEELDSAMKAFVLCVKLASVDQALSQLSTST